MTPCRTTVGVVLGSTGSTCGIETNWLHGLWSTNEDALTCWVGEIVQSLN